MIYVSIGNLQIKWKWSEGWSQNTGISDTRPGTRQSGGGEGDCSAQIDGTLTRATPGTGDIHPDLLVQSVY